MCGVRPRAQLQLQHDGEGVFVGPDRFYEKPLWGSRRGMCTCSHASRDLCVPSNQCQISNILRVHSCAIGFV